MTWARRRSTWPRPAKGCGRQRASRGCSARPRTSQREPRSHAREVRAAPTRREEITMYLSRYDFAGEPSALHAALERVKERIPAGDILLNVAVSTETGVSLYDACPDRAAFEEFSTSREFTTLIAEAGLP